MTDRRIRAQLAVLLVTTVVVTSLAAGAAALVDLSPGEPSRSRVAADRPCPEAATVDLVPRPAGLRMEAVEVGRADQPSMLALRPDEPAEGVLAERRGRLRRIVGGELRDEVVLDLTGDTSDDGDGGLLGVAYSPDGRWLYLLRTTEARDDVLTAHPVQADGSLADGTGRELLRVDHPPSEQHHGGGLVVDADGVLYAGFGDGGGLGDPGENAQDPGVLLGKVIRIRPTPEADAPYAVPADNPFVDAFGWRPEIWVRGVRNPFRLSLDAATGDLWLGDVGQACVEEVDRLPASAAGANLGWDRREGTLPFEGGDVPGRDLDPVAERPHADGWCALVAGHVVRGDELPALDGWLLVTDYCRGRVEAIRTWGDGVEAVDLGVEVDGATAVVAGPNGLPWVLSLQGPVVELRPR